MVDTLSINGAIRYICHHSWWILDTGRMCLFLWRLFRCRLRLAQGHLPWRLSGGTWKLNRPFAFTAAFSVISFNLQHLFLKPSETGKVHIYIYICMWVWVKIKDLGDHRFKSIFCINHPIIGVLNFCPYPCFYVYIKTCIQCVFWLLGTIHIFTWCSLHVNVLLVAKIAWKCFSLSTAHHAIWLLTIVLRGWRSLYKGVGEASINIYI